MFNDFFPTSCLIWDNMKKYGRAKQAKDDDVIGRVRFVCWVTKATDTNSEYVMLIACHGSNGYEKAPKWYDYTYKNCIVKTCI